MLWEAKVRGTRGLVFVRVGLGFSVGLGFGFGKRIINMINSNGSVNKLIECTDGIDDSEGMLEL